jgi:hypothetical protein
MAETEDEIRRRVEKRYQKRQELYWHIGAYLVANAVFWLMFHQMWILWITVGWGVGVISHILDYYNKYGGGAERRETEIQREVEREMTLRGAYEKPKNDDVQMRLTDDGELEAVPDGEISGAEKHKGIS